MKKDRRVNSQNQEQRRMTMLNAPISKVIPRMAIPTIVAFLINSIYSMADTYFVTALGTNATAAVSVNSSLDQVILMCGSMLAMGANSYIARLLGKGDDKKASQVLSTAFFLAAGIGLTLAVFGSIFMTPMVRLLGATATCERYAIEYATYVLLAAPFMAANFVMNQCLRSEGNAFLSMVGMSAGGILNCILDPIFITGLNMGVAGASLATAICKFISFVILIVPYLKRKSLLHLSIRNFRMSRDILAEVVGVGSSSMFRSGLAVVSAILLNQIAGQISDSVLAGIGVCNKIMMFPFSIILGFGSGFQPVAGFNWGAKRYDRVSESYRFSSWVSILGSVVLGVALYFTAPVIIQIFAGQDPDMLRIATLCLRLQCLAMPIHGWVVVVNMLCVSLGEARGALLLSTARQGTCFLPIVVPMGKLWGADGLAGVQATADVLSLIMAVPLAVRMGKMIRMKGAGMEVSEEIPEVIQPVRTE